MGMPDATTRTPRLQIRRDIAHDGQHHLRRVRLRRPPGFGMGGIEATRQGLRVVRFTPEKHIGVG
jgi:hypothetical protein